GTGASGAQSRGCGVAVVRKPTRPRFTPRMGVWAPLSVRAPRNRVPSPPRVIRQSSCGARWSGGGGGAGSGQRGPISSSVYRVTPSRGATCARCAGIFLRSGELGLPTRSEGGRGGEGGG